LGGPLGSKSKAAVANPMENAELRNEIKKDVERTY
jgi:TBC1 domain family protein 5